MLCCCSASKAALTAVYFVALLLLVVNTTGFTASRRFTSRYSLQQQQLNQRVTQSWRLSSSPQNEDLFSTTTEQQIGQPTELPDSLQDAANIAAKASAKHAAENGAPSRCRVEFDTSVGDETYTSLQFSSEFMQKFVTSLCYLMIDGLADDQEKEEEEKVLQMQRIAQARKELRALGQPRDDDSEEVITERAKWVEVLKNQGKVPVSENEKDDDEEEEEENVVPTWNGPIARIYFPDEGSAAMAKRDWLERNALVPPCVEFSSASGVQWQDCSKDVLVFFFCPQASEAQRVQDILAETEDSSPSLKLSVFVNPNLVDMGVTGFGMAGRRLRQRLLDQLECTYYLRTLPWGALTRIWPGEFSIWQEDADAEGGYRLIRSMDRLPSNPEVVDIYDEENDDAGNDGGDGGNKNNPANLFGAINDFVTGLSRL